LKGAEKEPFTSNGHSHYAALHFSLPMSELGHSRRFDYQTATSALPRTTDISDRPGMSEKCDFRTASDVPKVNLAHPARLAYRLSGQS
jgi:hypothetical protein